MGRVLRAFRERKGLTQQRLGFRAHLHMNYVSEVEGGKRNISWDALNQLLDALDLTWEEFGAELDRVAKPKKGRPRSNLAEENA